MSRLSGNPNWQGGKSFEKYSLDWTDELREIVRKRDSQTCQKCGITENDLKGMHKKLDVHHINSNKQDCRLVNLISFCKRCHPKRNGYSKNRLPKSVLGKLI